MCQRQQHHRTSSHARKTLPPCPRPAKAPILRRGNSYNHAPLQANTLTTASQFHPNAVSRKVGWQDVSYLPEKELEESGMASFLQFCATCEKQIVTPGTNILYCSEACRKRDISQQTSIQSIQSLDGVKLPSGFASTPSYADPPSADIIPQMSPTRRPWSLSFSELYQDEITASNYDGSDDAGEKPAGSDPYYDEYSSSTSPHVGRPYMDRTLLTTDTTLPSLVHSPSSSWGTVASHMSYRPLASRHNPFSMDHHKKSVDLVIPYFTAPLSPTQSSSLKSSASTLTSYRVAHAGDISYDQRSSSSSSSSQHSHPEPAQYHRDDMKALPQASH